MGITAHVLILAGAAIDHNPLLCVAVELDDELFGRHRDARDTRETQHIAPVAYQAGSSCRHTTPLRRTASGTVTCIRGMWGRMPAIQPARRKHRRSTEDLLATWEKRRDPQDDLRSG